MGAPLYNFDPVGSSTINKEAIFTMLKNISNEQYVLMPTTNSAYGNAGGEKYCDEESELNPVSKYAKDKVEVEKELMSHESAVSFSCNCFWNVSSNENRSSSQRFYPSRMCR